ncbi:MAG: hypothetical protein ACJA08_002446 [Cyclobacteriaceae bacterium]|jgi:uncharacterized protein (TIGR02453 family)
MRGKTLTLPILYNNTMQHSFTFLTQLQQNNNREWFNKNKETYLQSHEEVIAFADDVLSKLKETDQIETQNGKKGLMRIYRDTRFSNNKTPYKSGWSCSFKRATAALRGGYYFRIEPGNTAVAGGFWGPDPKDLKLIRDQIAAEDDSLRGVLNEPNFKSYFGDMQGEQVKSSPKGFSKDDLAIDLLRYKQFLLVKHFKDEEVLKADFAAKVADGFARMRPFHDYFSYILTHDLNGVTLIK